MTPHLLPCVLLFCSVAVSAQQKAKAYANVHDRRMATLSLWDGKRATYCHVEYGSPTWRGAFEKVMPKLRGARVRFGKDAWAKLEVVTPMTIAGKQVDPGVHCLAFDCAKDGTWSLVLLDPEGIRRATYALLTPRIIGIGKLYPLTMTRTKTSSPKLTVEFVPDAENAERAELRIRFGPRELTAPVVVDFKKAVVVGVPTARRSR